MSKEQFLSFLIALVVGVMISLLGYFLNLNTLKRERVKRKHDELLEARQSLLAELNTNREITEKAKESLGRNRVMMPFTNEAWQANSGKMHMIPQELRDCLRNYHLLVFYANSIVQMNLQLGYGKGYLDKNYNDKVDEIKTKGNECIKLLNALN